MRARTVITPRRESETFRRAARAKRGWGGEDLMKFRAATTLSSPPPPPPRPSRLIRAPVARFGYSLQSVRHARDGRRVRRESRSRPPESPVSERRANTAFRVIFRVVSLRYLHRLSFIVRPTTRPTAVPCVRCYDIMSADLYDTTVCSGRETSRLTDR